jgi:hypothetical protein
MHDNLLIRPQSAKVFNVLCLSDCELHYFLLIVPPTLTIYSYNCLYKMNMFTKSKDIDTIHVEGGKNYSSCIKSYNFFNQLM